MIKIKLVATQTVKMPMNTNTKTAVDTIVEHFVNETAADINNELLEYSNEQLIKHRDAIKHKHSNTICRIQWLSIASISA